MPNPCIKCNDCAVVCPIQLQPQFLHAALNAKAWEQAEQLNLNACLLCNACTSACPSQIDLREQFAEGLKTLTDITIQHEKSLIAKQRFESKQARMHRQSILLAEKRAHMLRAIGKSPDAESA